MLSKEFFKKNNANLTILFGIMSLNLFVLITNIFFDNIVSFYLPNILIYLLNCICFLYFTNFYKNTLTRLVNRYKDVVPIIENVFIAGLYVIFLYNLLPIFNITKNINSINDILLITLVVIGYFLFIFNNRARHEPSTKKLNNNFKISLIILSISFVLIRLCIPIFFNGSFIDEYVHILSGIDLFNYGHFPQFNVGITYNRGEYVSLIVGIFLKLFGNTILVAKLVPALLGIINFFLLLNILRTIGIDRKWLFLTLLIYTISPFVIFNHFYIRFYVFYEYFLLSNLLLTLLIAQNGKKFITKNIILLILNNSFLLIFSNDPGGYFPALSSFIPLVYIYYNFDKIFQNLAIKNKLLRSLLLNKKSRIIIILSTMSTLFFLLNGPDKIARITGGILEYGSKYTNYYIFFTNSNVVILTFFLIASLSIPFEKKHLEKIITITAGLIFFIHTNQNTGIQIIRAITYFLPLFYLVSILAISKLNFNNIKTVFIYLLLISTIIFNYPPKFFNGPYLPFEINYVDYEKAYTFLKNQCSNSEKYAILAEPYISNFYNVHIDYTTYVIPQLLYGDPDFTKNNNGTFENFYGKIKTITDPQLLNKIRGQNVCIIISNRYVGSGRYIPENDFNSIGLYFKKQEFTSLNVYYK
jgi:hypothetical protein